MNDNFTNTNPEDADFADKLNALSEGAHIDPRFANELERKLKAVHKPRTVWLKAPASSILPSLGWIALVVVAGLALIWTIQNLVPKPHPATNQTPAVVETATPSQDSVIQNATPDANRPGYDFRGAKLTVDTTLPQSPAQANVYKLKPSQPATIEYTQALARQFGIDGDIYNVENGQIANLPALMVTDGKQQLVVYAENYYTYTSDLVEWSRNYNGFPNDNAESIIREYLSSHGLDFRYRIEKSDLFGGYALQQISPDGLPMQFDSQTQPAMRITLDSNGNVLTVLATMMNYDPAPIGSYGIINAEEALQMVLDDTLPGGKLETSSSGGPSQDFIPPQSWYRNYPDNQTVTIFGNVSSSQPVDPSKPAIVFIDSVSATGNTAGMESLDYYTFVKATGQFVVDGNVRKFNVEAWENAQQAYLTGSVQRDGDQFILTADDGGKQYPIIDAPSDLPLDIDPTKSQISFDGLLVDGKIDWRNITYYPDASQMGGGGGGGGYGFYKLNLSGTPIPFPTSIPMGQGYTQAEIAGFLKYTIQNGDTLGKIAQTYNVSMDELLRINNLTDGNMIYVGQQLVIPGVAGATRLDGEPGTLMVNIYAKPDGRLRTVYGFASQKDQTYYQLTGDNLEPLQKLHGHPISIWGSISYDQYGAPFLSVEKFAELYPGLQFQLVTGTQEMKEVNGESLVLITSNGVTYVQMGNTGGYPDGNYDPKNKEALIEGIIVPNETYAGYPTIRVFSIGPATDVTTGQPFEFPNSAATPEVLPDPFGNADQYAYPDVIVETVELVYYSINPTSQVTMPEGETYVQPAWHFRGKFSNGSTFDVLIQALKQQYLSPELDQNVTPG